MFLCLRNRHLVDRTISQAPDTLLLHEEPHHSRYHSLNLLLLLRPNELGSSTIIWFFLSYLFLFLRKCIYEGQRKITAKFHILG